MPFLVAGITAKFLEDADTLGKMVRVGLVRLGSLPSHYYRVWNKEDISAIGGWQNPVMARQACIPQLWAITADRSLRSRPLHRWLPWQGRNWHQVVLWVCPYCQALYARSIILVTIPLSFRREVTGTVSLSVTYHAWQLTSHLSPSTICCIQLLKLWLIMEYATFKEEIERHRHHHHNWPQFQQFQSWTSWAIP